MSNDENLTLESGLVPGGFGFMGAPEPPIRSPFDDDDDDDVNARINAHVVGDQTLRHRTIGSYATRAHPSPPQDTPTAAPAPKPRIHMLGSWLKKNCRCSQVPFLCMAAVFAIFVIFCNLLLFILKVFFVIVCKQRGLSVVEPIEFHIKTFWDDPSTYLKAITKYRPFIVKCSWGCLGFIFILFLLSPWFSSAGDARIEVIRPTFSRIGLPGVDFTQPSSSITCDELRLGRFKNIISISEKESLVVLREFAEHFLTPRYRQNPKDLPECVCAPMFGTRRRFTSVRMVDGEVEHLYNVVIDEAWNGDIGDGTSIEATQSPVIEEQMMLFPRETETVDVWREDAVRVTYKDVECKAYAMVFTGRSAWCIQACDDLFNGVTVYDKQVK